MRIAITSRIFEPEPSAASFRLGALAAALAEAGHLVEVLTVRPPARLAGHRDSRPFRVVRFPVLRDGSGYVRGYLPYLSFDVPLFFRILFGRRRDLIVTEPPPTTGFFVRLAAALRRTPYAYYAADIWSQASQQTSAPAWMVRLVRRVERFALRGAAVVLSVSPDVTDRVRALGVRGRIETIGNGVDVEAFHSGLPDPGTKTARDPARPAFVYAGTASEWHGAEVFVEAMTQVLEQLPGARLEFIGGGVERERLEDLARRLGVSHAVSFEDALPPQQLAGVLWAATAAIASVRPASSYEFAFPTKLYSAAACGAPLIYSGEGPTRDFVANEVDGEALGVSLGADGAAVAVAMIEMARRPASDDRRRRVAAWAADQVGLRAVARRAVLALTEAAKKRGPQ